MLNKKTPSGLLFPLIMAFSVASATLLLQIIQTRIYAVVFWNHIVYLIVSIALLGFGISGTWLAFGEEGWFTKRLTIPVAAVGFVIATLVSGVLVPQWDVVFSQVFNNGYHLTRLFSTYAIAVLPYFFAGWILGLIYRNHADSIHRLYFADLTGAAVGCLIALLLIRPFGAINLVLISCALVTVPVLIREAHRRRVMALPLSLSLLVLALLAYNSKVIEKRIQPDGSKSFMRLYEQPEKKAQKTIEMTEWSLLARTDIVATDDPPSKLIFIDGDAWTAMELNSEDTPSPFLPDAEPLISSRTPYLLSRSFDDTLVIGSGGGGDVWAAIRAGAKKVDAVEINPTTARVVQEEYRTATHDLFFRPGVTLYNEEGRSFVRRSPEHYNVIMINAIDTFAALNSGAYTLAENYLYTVEAMVDYITHLETDGQLCIARWDYAGEIPRLFVIMLEALYELGYSEPDSHIIALKHNNFSAIMVSPTKYSVEEIAILRDHCAKHNGVFYFPANSDTYSHPMQATLSSYTSARRIGQQDVFFDDYEYNIQPVWDDSPFFFHYERLGNLFAVFQEIGGRDFIRGHWSSFTLFLLVFLISMALLFFILLPLAKRGRIKVPGFARWLLFFCCIGFSFIFTEICFMQRFALLLGSPTMSLALVLAALLLSAGIGSYMKERLGIPLELALALLAVILLCAAFGYPYIIRGLLGFPLIIRQVVTVMMVFPAGFFMGMPFPSGIQIISKQSTDMVPWMWGVNGGATVLGSVLSIVVAIYFGFTVVLLLATTGYICALAIYRTRTN